MDSYVIVASLCLLMIQVNGCKNESTVGDIRQEDTIRKVASASNGFSFLLHKQLTAGGQPNIFYSPLSLSVALAMAYYGARGTTASEMQNALGYSSASLSTTEVPEGYKGILSMFSKSSEEYTLAVANAAVVDRYFPIRQEYKDGISKIFGATLKSVDFAREGDQALIEINQWVKEQTMGKIPNLLKGLDPLTVAVLLNAVYFKGVWKTKFEETDTFSAPFFNDGIISSSTTVDMMHVTANFSYANIDEGGYKVLEIPYSGEDISMLVLLPEDIGGLPALEARLDGRMLKKATSKMENTEVRLSLPKFQIKYKSSVKRQLQSLGMKTAFSDKADFTGITGEPSIKISDVVHSAVIEVNEEGSEASAATAVIAITRAFFPGQKVPVFIVDRPFLFFIMDKRNDMVIFTGRVSRL